MMGNIDDTFDDEWAGPFGDDDDGGSDYDDGGSDYDDDSISSADWGVSAVSSKAVHSSVSLSSLCELVKAKQDYVSRARVVGGALKNYVDQLERLQYFNFWNPSPFREHIDAARIVEMVDWYRECFLKCVEKRDKRDLDLSTEEARHEKSMAAFYKQKTYYNYGDQSKGLNQRGEAREESLISKNTRKNKAIKKVYDASAIAITTEYFSKYGDVEGRVLVDIENRFQCHLKHTAEGFDVTLATSLALQKRYSEQELPNGTHLFEEGDAMKIASCLAKFMRGKRKVTYDELYLAGVEAIKRDGVIGNVSYYTNLIFSFPREMHIVFDHLLVRLIEMDVFCAKVENNTLSLRLGEHYAPGKQLSYDGWVSGRFIPEGNKAFAKLRGI